MSDVIYYEPDEDGVMQPEGTWQSTDYCWVRREDYAKLEAKVERLKAGLDLIINMDPAMFTLGDACTVAINAVKKENKS